MPPRFCILGSGSAGNCALLETAGARVLIDAGFSARKLGQLLEAVGCSLASIDAIFLTHEHGDHAAAVEGLKKFPALPIFANHGTARALQAGLRHTPAWQLFETGSRFTFRDLTVDAFSVPHDARDPVGFRFSFPPGAAPLAGAPAAATPDTAPSPSRAGQDGHRALAWLTDLGHVPRHLHEHVQDCDALIIEANHCPELLRADTKRPWSTKQRIAGRHGHLSNQALADLLAEVASPRWRHIVLTHLSRDCNSESAIHTALAPLKARLNCSFAIASQDQPTAFTSL